MKAKELTPQFLTSFALKGHIIVSVWKLFTLKKVVLKKELLLHF